MAERIPSRELNERIAKEVMGWIRKPLTDEPPFRGTVNLWFASEKDVANNNWQSGVRPFSSDLAASFQVVEALRAKGWYCEISLRCAYRGGDENRDTVTFTRYPDEETTLTASAHGDGLPLVICLAALKAIESEPSSLPTENR